MPSRKGKPNKEKWEIRQIIEQNVDFAKVVRALAKLAPRNPNAAKLLFEYGFGKPSQVIDLNHAGTVSISLIEARTVIDHLFNGHPAMAEEVPGKVGAGPQPVPGGVEGQTDRVLDGDSV